MRTVRKVQPVMTNVYEKAQKMGKKRYDYFRIDTGEQVRIIDFVRVHQGRYYVVAFNCYDSRYYGPIRMSSYGTQFYCSTMEAVARARGYHYDKHSRAVERAMKEFGIERRERS